MEETAPDSKYTQLGEKPKAIPRPRTYAPFRETDDASLLRIDQILGNPKANPPLPAIIPVGRSTWWAGVKSGKFPQPIRLGARTTAWRKSDIIELLEKGM